MPLWCQSIHHCFPRSRDFIVFGNCCCCQLSLLRLLLLWYQFWLWLISMNKREKKRSITIISSAPNVEDKTHQSLNHSWTTRPSSAPRGKWRTRQGGFQRRRSGAISAECGRHAPGWRRQSDILHIAPGQSREHPDNRETRGHVTGNRPEGDKRFARNMPRTKPTTRLDTGLFLRADRWKPIHRTRDLSSDSREARVKVDPCCWQLAYSSTNPLLAVYVVRLLTFRLLSVHLHLQFWVFVLFCLLVK